MPDISEAPGGHPILDSIILACRASLGRSVARDKFSLHVLKLWEIVAATTGTEAEALRCAGSLHSIAINHYLTNRPAAVPLQSRCGTCWLFTATSAAFRNSATTSRQRPTSTGTTPT